MRRGATAAASVGLLVMLVGCQGDADEPASPGAEPQTTAAGPTVPVNLPTDCAAVGSALAGVELYDESADLVQPAPSGASVALGCEWAGGEVAGVTLVVSTASPEAVSDAAGGLADLGFTCDADLGGQLCIVTEDAPVSLDGIDTTIALQEIVFARNGVWVYVATAETDGQALAREVAAEIFG
ncbi:MAG: hypothetical protein FWE61_07390 [Micrococcales bacterium]|nr:hypothetical protein [Micrococcales bacterium]